MRFGCAQGYVQSGADRLGLDALDFNISRTPVSEAFNRLGPEDLIKIEPPRVTFVCSLEQIEMAKICDVCVSLEMAALRHRLGMHPHHMDKSYREHLRIVECIEARDLDSALEILNGHIGLEDGSYWVEADGEHPDP